jgi:hypothetical protein
MQAQLEVVILGTDKSYCISREDRCTNIWIIILSVTVTWFFFSKHSNVADPRARKGGRTSFDLRDPVIV